VESCTALVEHQDGRLEILHWAEIAAARDAAAQQEPALKPQRAA
jgi:hypothetical protein